MTLQRAKGLGHEQVFTFLLEFTLPAADNFAGQRLFVQNPPLLKQWSQEVSNQPALHGIAHKRAPSILMTPFLPSALRIAEASVGVISGEAHQLFAVN